MLERSASFSKNHNGSRFEAAIWTAKLMLLSIGVVSTFLWFKVALIPCMFESVVPRCLSCVRACLSPPYIYVIVNFIIISIAASSSSSSPAADKSTSGENYEEESNFVEARGAKVSAQSKCDDTTNVQNDIISYFSVGSHVAETDDSEAELVVKREVGISEDAFPYSENSPPLAEDEEGDSYDDSLDGTWKAIMEGKGTVRRPFLKKSDTWNATRAPPAFPLAERVSNSHQKPQKPEMRKSETFNDRVTTLRAGGGFRRETLLTSQDSLNARVEAFINKFNNDMRMERQQSDMRHINMVKQQAAAAAAAT